MSGGVDSSVVAGLLAEAGHEVIGVTLQLYDHGAAAAARAPAAPARTSTTRATWPTASASPHYVIDARGPVPRGRDRRLRRQLCRGPDPGALRPLQPEREVHRPAGLARDLGAEAMATGHYVRRVDGADGPELHRAARPARDQSWFLFATTARAAGLHPLPARRHAGQGGGARRGRAAGPGVAAKPDSQDICFVPGGRYADLVAAMRPDAAAAGEIVDAGRDGAGPPCRHRRFTVGQGAAGRRPHGRRAAGGAGAGRRPAAVVVGPRSAGARQVRCGT